MAGKASTPKLRALGVALRKAREAKDVSLRELARQLGDDAGALGRYEKGERGTTPEKVARILATLGVNGEDYESIMALTRDAEGPLWVAVSLPEQQHQFDALLEFEENAISITKIGPLLVPGLLQTREYTQAIMSTDSDVPAIEIRRRVNIRSGRKDILTRVDPVPMLAMISEGVLDQLIGTPAVMVGQLQYLLDMGKRDNVTIRVIPKMSGWHPGLEGSFDLIESDPMPVVQLETRRSSLFLHEEKDLGSYRRAAEQVSEKAMSPAESAGLIGKYIERWEDR
ncbi:MAG TPA: helix-turn-helix transcriptional regulator [Pseudonocardiaceae bacterium]|jgi:transcriptional regulator with XRE-family HTH domain|nr:helix-turn-helix transcriptional regulator [Pseudonocardiaceae bacterium]